MENNNNNNNNSNNSNRILAQNPQSENTAIQQLENQNQIPIKQSASQSAKQNKNIDSDDLKKAIIFLLGKELKDYSIEKKREYLSRKISPETLDKAMEIYPIIEANTNAKVEDFVKEYEMKNSKSSFFDGLFDIGVLTTVIISTLGINYLLDLQRNKKNEIFYKESEKKLNEELSKITENMKKEISNELGNFCKKTEVEDKIKEKIALQNQSAGLNLNLGSKNLKDNVNNLKNELSVHEQKLKEMSVKLDNSGVILKQDVLKEISSLIEENNKGLLMKIIEMQNKLIIDSTSASNSNAIRIKNAQEDVRENLQVGNTIKNNEASANKEDDSSISFINRNKSRDEANKNSSSVVYYSKDASSEPEKMKDIQDYFNSAFPNKEEPTATSQIYNLENSTAKDNIEIKDNINLPNPLIVKRSNLDENSNLNNKMNTENTTTSTVFSDHELTANKAKEVQLPSENKNDIDFQSAFSNVLNTLDESKRTNFILQIKNNFSAILENNRHEESANTNINKINLSNGVFRTIQSNLMQELLESAGFSKESQYKFIFVKEKISNLEQAVDCIENYQA